MSLRLITGVAAALLTSTMLTAGPANATAVVVANNTFTLTGTFPSGASDPFAPGAFTLALTAPSSFLASGFSIDQVASIGATGTFTDGGSTVDITGGAIDVFGTSPDGLEIDGYLGSYPITASFSLTATSPMYSATVVDANDTFYAFNTGTYAFTFASATVNNDPAISNAAMTIAGANASAVPEPASFALLLAPLLALGLIRRQHRPN